jgi:phosphonate transport system permease protein
MPADLYSSRRWSRASLIFLAIFVLLFIYSYREAEIDPFQLFSAQARASLADFLRGLFPPEFSPQFLSSMARSVIETVQISIMGTLLAILLGFPLGLLATSTLTYTGVLSRGSASWPADKSKYLPYIFSRTILNLLRSVPEFIWALIFVRALGLGPFAGVLALAVAYGGTLGKIYSEILEKVDPNPIEALAAGGTSKIKIILYGYLPQALPDFISYTLYRWECAIRAAAILGFVGAGGLGQQIMISMRMFRYNEVVTLIIIIFFLVMAVDQLSAAFRKRIL